MLKRNIYNMPLERPDDGMTPGGAPSLKPKIKSKKAIKQIIATAFTVLILGGAVWGIADYSQFKAAYPEAGFDTYITQMVDSNKPSEKAFFENMSETEHVFEGTTEAEYKAYYNQITAMIVERYFKEQVGNVPNNFNEFKLEFITLERYKLKLYMTACDNSAEITHDKSPIWKATATYTIDPLMEHQLNEIIDHKDYDIMRHVNHITDHIEPTNDSLIKLSRLNNHAVNKKINRIIYNNNYSMPNNKYGTAYGIWQIDEENLKASALWSADGLYTTFGVDLSPLFFSKTGDVYSVTIDTNESTVDTTETLANRKLSAISTCSEHANNFKNTTSSEQ